MKVLKRLWATVIGDERGQGLVEYGLIIALVAVAAILVLIFLGGAISEKFQDVGKQIQDAKPIQ